MEKNTPPRTPPEERYDHGYGAGGKKTHHDIGAYLIIGGFVALIIGVSLGAMVLL